MTQAGSISLNAVANQTAAAAKPASLPRPMSPYISCCRLIPTEWNQFVLPPSLAESAQPILRGG